MDKIKKILGKTLLLAAMMIASTSANAQGLITGQVLDSQNEPVIGATVTEKSNPKNGTITDFDGKFSIKVAAGTPLSISYVGMTTQEQSAQNGMTIVMQDDKKVIDEVVVVGYTSKARRDLTGSVGSISGTKLAVVPVASAAVALQGKIAGVQVTTTDGAPGADVSIKVRGATSITQSNEPLYIVDGFEATDINDIPPSDIASIDVLKDASLTAVYGAKGGNGVVVVTTKSAKEGKVQVGFNGRLTVAHLSKKLDLMNTSEFVDYIWDRAAAGNTRSAASRYFRANFGNPADLDIYQRAATHDWQDEVMGETPLNYSANVTIGGGNEKIKFNTSLTQSEDKGIILATGVRRTNFNFKLSVDITKNLTFKMNPKLTYRRDIGDTDRYIGSMQIIDVLRYRPTNGLREFAYWDEKTVDPDVEKNFEYTNPKNDVQTNTRLRHDYNIVNQFSLDWRPLKGLTLTTNFSHQLRFRDTNVFSGPLTSTGQKHNSLPVAEITNRTTEGYTWTNTANYGMTINDDHNLSFLLGHEISHSQYKETYQMNRYFPRDITDRKAWDNMTLGTPYQSTTTRTTPTRMLSYFAQANYNYMHRYLLSLTMRADGSSKFAKGHRWGYFPSVSGAWVISDEPFMKDVKWVDNLKLRAAIGLAGNNRISDDMWRYLYAISASGGPGFGESTTLGENYYYSNNGGKSSYFTNPEIKWETTVTRNIAADISLFGGRLNITPEFYWNTTRDLLYLSDIPSTTGYTAQMQNIGKVTNKGVELTVNYDFLRGTDYVFTANLTFGHNKMKVNQLNSTDNIIYNNFGKWSSDYDNNSKGDYILEVGKEVGLIYGFVYDGIYSADEFDFDPVTYEATPKEGTVINNVLNDSQSGVATLPGKIKLKDINGDGVVDDNDRTVLGHTTPRYQGGFGLSGQWKDFDFAMNFTYMLDFKVINSMAYALSSSSSSRTTFYNVLSKFTDRWRYTRTSDGENMYMNTALDNTVEEYTSMNANTTNWNPADVVNNVLMSNFVENGSFVRCSDITIGYTLPKKISQKAGMSKLRFYASASNLFILTSYSGYDPEVDIQSGLTPNMDWNRYPRNRSFSLGVNVTF